MVLRSMLPKMMVLIMMKDVGDVDEAWLVIPHLLVGFNVDFVADIVVLDVDDDVVHYDDDDGHGQKSRNYLGTLLVLMLTVEEVFCPRC